MVSAAGMFLGFIFGVGGIALIVHCVQFDKLRRSDPNYKMKVKERRKAERAAEKEEFKRQRENVKFPQEGDFSSLQDFVIQEIQEAEMLLTRGKMDEGIEHLVNVTIVSSRPQEFLKFLKDSLSSEAFELLLNKLPKSYRRMTV